MIVIVIILAIIGLLALIALAVAALSDERSSPPEPDLAAPYREGLHAAIRLQRTAQNLEQQIYAEAQAAQQRHDAESTAVPGEVE
jgi:hypothetical protein